MLKPTPVEAATYYQEFAREFARKQNQDTARLAYFYCIQSWGDAMAGNPELVDRFYAAEHEYGEFAKTDVMYIRVLKIIKQIAIEYPGITVDDLIAILHDYKREDIGYVLYFGQKHGELLKTNDGEVYELKLPRT
jgi:hypothetical protein